MTAPRTNPVVQHWQPRSKLEALGLRFVQVFNDHDLGAGLALCDPDVVSVPSRVTGTAEGYRGHDGIREWWERVNKQSAWFEILVSSMQEVAQIQPGRNADGSRTLAMFGEVCLEGESLSPWACVIVVRDTLVIRHRSYLSAREPLDEVGLLPDPAQAPGSDR